MSTPRSRGRPRAADVPVSADDILGAALRAFARDGYDGMSVRTLTRELGLSHNAIPQRFGTKEQLWYAAVDRGFGGLTALLAEGVGRDVIEGQDPLQALHGAIRRFLHYSARNPELLRIMSAEGDKETPRLDYLYDTYVGPATAPLADLLERLAAEGHIRPTPLRTLHFLITSGGAAPFSMTALARKLDRADRLDDRPDPLAPVAIDPGAPGSPAAIDAHAELVADIIVAGLRR